MRAEAEKQTIMQFNDVLAEHTANHGTIPAGWKQGRATYGGLAGAMLYRSLELVLPEPRPLRWASFSLVGPSDVGAVQMSPTILRTGKNVTQGQCLMRQGGETVAVLQAAFGSGRDSEVNLAGAEPPAFPAPQDCFHMPRVEGVVPEFMQHFQLAIARGDVPFMGKGDGQLGGWVRFSDPVGKLGTAQLIGMLDAWPPTILSMLSRPAPGSTLTWTIDFIEPESDQSGNDWWQYMATTEAAGDGYAHSTARLWDGDGKLMVVSHQTIAVFG